jgi:argininosuccinate lyase
VAHCESRGIELHEIADADLASISEHLDPSVKAVLDVDGALAGRTTPGSTGPKAVSDQLAEVRDQVAAWRAWSE